MVSSIVIKVKYGKILRRFNVLVNEAGKLDLSIVDLREKVLSLFKLSPEVDLALIYLDEDGDSVTLADDEDLDDIIRQSLNPLRITVKLYNKKGDKSSVSSKQVYTPKPSASASHSLSTINKTVSDILKDVPGPLGEALSKLSLNLASKETASSLQIPELVQQLSKIVQKCVITASESQIGAESGKTKEPEGTVAGKNKPRMVVGPTFVRQPLYEENVKPGFTTQGKNTFSAPDPSSIFVDTDHPSNGKKEGKRTGESSLNAKPSWENIKAVASSVLGNDDKGVKMPSFSPNDYWNGVFNKNLAGECPFAGTLVGNDFVAPYSHSVPRVHPFKRSYSQGGVASIFHSGVQCDGCGVHPITGPRFKSKVKHDYDLCSICFADMGCEADYIRLDRPTPNRHCPFRKRVYDFNARTNPSPIMPQAPTGFTKQTPLKLDSRFVSDVTVNDGEMVAPFTPFTKIWRMRNSGNVVWPQGTQLVWIGGERLSAPLRTELQIPADGIAVESELEVSVDFVAPDLPGRYISYWRLASSSGQKFGQRIWVLIQVDVSLKYSAANNSFEGLNLNLSPESNGLNRAENQAINVEPIVIDGRYSFPEPSKKATDLVEPFVEPLPNKYKKVQNLVATPTPPPMSLVPESLSAQESGNKDDVEEILLKEFIEPLPNKYQNLVATPTPPPMPLVPESLSAEESGNKDDVEEILLKELEEMGFKQVDLNKEILRVNEYNLEQSVDDLCGVSEWDPILEELQEMGFNDNEVNKKLLKMNNGSIKGVVMDLLTGKKV